ncbi:MAG TPA: DUF4920 domain-containing protein [Polyangiales bacterium]|nr:DUF4920 domain-containing protein [Polyangiales bacterium]
MRWAAALLLVACNAAEPTPAPKPNVPSPPARAFGAPLSNRAPVYPVDAVLADPEPLVGKSIACRGTVARVCQAAGCWLELQAEGASEGLRVPMANHAFFIPQDAVGHAAVIEGQLKRHELPEAQREHYAGEGMKSMGPLSLDATSVALW